MKDPTIKKIFCGAYFNLIFKENGQLFFFGNYDYNYNGENVEATQPKLLLEDTKIKEIYCGGDFFLLLKEDGELIGFGKNEYSQLSVQDLVGNSVHSNILITKNEDIVDVSCGYYHTLFSTKNGDLFGFGSNERGELVESNEYNQSLGVTLITNDPSIKHFICGFARSLIYKQNGDLIVMGDNYLSDFEKLDVDKESIQFPFLLMNSPNIVSIHCAFQHTFIYLQNGDLYAFGDTSDGRLSRKFEHEYILRPFLLRNDPTILSFCGQVNVVWKAEHHLSFSLAFQQTIQQFVFSLKRIEKQTRLKIPKFVLFEIIKFTV